MFQKYSVALLSFLFLLQSCDTKNSSPKHKGAIVFGDSSLIVTETDPQYLTNHINDFEPVKAAKAEVPIEPNTAATATEAPTVAAAHSPTDKGLEAPFKSLPIFIAGVEGRLGAGGNWDKDRSAAFTLTEGTLDGKTLKIDNSKISSVQMRYQTVLLLKMPDGNKLEIDAMPNYTSDWEKQKGNNGLYKIDGLGSKELKYANKFSSRNLTNAIQKLARSKRMSRSDEKALMRLVRNVRRADQAPVSIGLSTVIWKIDAKDDKGNNIHRELRIDLHP